MQSFYLGTLGFGALFAADLLRWRGTRRPVRFFAIAGYFLVLCAILWLAFSGAAAPLSSSSARFGLIIAISATLLLIYSVFIEIPLARRRKVHQPDRAIGSGTYSFSRHPGFLWFVLLQTGILLMRGDLATFLAAAYLIVLDFLLVLGQDRFFFPRFFSNYSDYRQRVPFLFRVG